MKPGTAGTIGAICSVVTLAIAIILVIYAAGAKLATIETQIAGVTKRLEGIESTLEDLRDGRTCATTTGLGGGAEGDTSVGYTTPVVRLFPAGEGDDTDGALALYGDGPDSE